MKNQLRAMMARENALLCLQVPAQTTTDPLISGSTSVTALKI
jgi:hypothetical protein